MTPLELRAWERFAAATLSGLATRDDYADASYGQSAEGAALLADAMLEEWRKRQKGEEE